MSLQDNSENFLKYVNTISSCNSLSSSLHLNDQLANNQLEIVILFAAKFHSF